jgi:hypothetical protein
VPRTADFHDKITDACTVETARIVDDATALDAAVDVLDAHATAGNMPIRGFLSACECPAPRLRGRHDDGDLIEHERQEGEILVQPAACGQGVGHCLRHTLIMGVAGVSPTQKEDPERRVDELYVFHLVAFFGSPKLLAKGGVEHSPSIGVFSSRLLKNLVRPQTRLWSF